MPLLLGTCLELDDKDITADLDSTDTSNSTSISTGTDTFMGTGSVDVACDSKPASCDDLGDATGQNDGCCYNYCEVDEFKPINCGEAGYFLCLQRSFMVTMTACNR